MFIIGLHYQGLLYNLKSYLSSPASFAAGPEYPVSVYVAYGSGVNTDALFLGGNAPGSVNNAVGWNGSAFSNKPNYPKKELANTIIHEMLHIKNPTKPEESRIEKRIGVFATKIGENQGS